MSDKTLTCRDCGADFVFTAGEQDFYASRGLTNQPGRCPTCRVARKAGRGGYATGASWSGAGARREREMFPAVCGECGKDTQVPFQPRGDRPVYCSDCFERQRGASYSSRGRGRRDQW